MIEDPSAGLSKFPHGNLFQADPSRPTCSRPSQEFHNLAFSLGLHDPACGASVMARVLLYFSICYQIDEEIMWHA